MERRKIGLVVNPIAGMGGRVGLKGTDNVVEEAIKRGAEKVAPKRMVEMLQEFRRIHEENDVLWLTCGGEMGAMELEQAGYSDYEIVYNPPERTTSEDTKKACDILVEKGVELIVFCGGDGTARDVHSAVQNRVPILGIPSGVKMHSGVFAVSPRAGAEILDEYLHGQLEIVEGEIMDLDEDLYRQGKWNIKLYGTAKMPHEPTYIQTGKMMVMGMSEEEVLEAIADHIIEEIMSHPNTVYVLGSGSTMKYIGDKLGVDKTLLGEDVYYRGKLIKKDATEKDILDAIEGREAKIIVSPIGGQGFIFGRGNQQISPEVIKRVGIDNIIIVSTPAKLNATPVLRVDLDDPEVMEMFRKRKYLFVVTGYHQKVLRKVEAL